MLTTHVELQNANLGVIQSSEVVDSLVRGPISTSGTWCAAPMTTKIEVILSKCCAFRSAILHGKSVAFSPDCDILRARTTRTPKQILAANFRKHRQT